MDEDLDQNWCEASPIFLNIYGYEQDFPLKRSRHLNARTAVYVEAVTTR